jgi:hypothetical protein
MYDGVSHTSCPRLCDEACTEMVYMLHPIWESIQFQNGTGGRPIPIWKF